MAKKAAGQQVELKWKELLENVLTTPGQIEKSFSVFHNYSFGNMLAAMFQCKARGIEIGPMKTFNGWKDIDRTVKQGEKAIFLLQPFVKTDKNDPNNTSVFFVWKPRWFVLSQTDGADFDWSSLTPKWDKAKALKELGITEIPFEHPNGNVQGYATPKQEIAVNPLAQLPLSTLFHEVAHILLHTDKDGKELTTPTKEVEAESVALLMLETLGLEGAEFCRGYVQNWSKQNEIDEATASRIIKTTDKILRAGLPNKEVKD